MSIGIYPEDSFSKHNLTSPPPVYDFKLGDYVQFQERFKDVDERVGADSVFRIVSLEHAQGSYPSYRVRYFGSRDPNAKRDAASNGSFPIAGSYLEPVNPMIVLAIAARG